MASSGAVSRLRSRVNEQHEEAAPKAAPTVARDRTQVPVRLTRTQLRALKIHCVNADKPIQEFLLDAIRAEFARLGLTAFPDSDS